MRNDARAQGKVTYTRYCEPENKPALDLVLSVLEGTDDRAKMRLLRSLAILKSEHIDRAREVAQ
ncbi:hypothetical protein COO20_13410 [Thalassospira marina]|uniref:Uncharacterized protein n=2 Tax=Thalassospira marina TaxID=2048283 RepID=A0A2N3KSK1_9PROT|nr:hypothetical protein COO20_13410 [Thalassospira marina]